MQGEKSDPVSTKGSHMSPVSTLSLGCDPVVQMYKKMKVKLREKYTTDQLVMYFSSSFKAQLQSPLYFIT